MRAVSVSFSDALGGGGLVVPGDRVDVLISTTHGARFGPGEVLTPEDELIAAHPTVFTLLQNVLVLAIGQAFTQPPEAVKEEAELRLEAPVLGSAGTITLAVTPSRLPSPRKTRSCSSSLPTAARSHWRFVASATTRRPYSTSWISWNGRGSAP